MRIADFRLETRDSILSRVLPYNPPMPKFAMALVLGAAALTAQTAATGPYGMQFVQIPSGELSMG
jgi:hypothetical protein